MTNIKKSSRLQGLCLGIGFIQIHQETFLFLSFNLLRIRLNRSRFKDRTIFDEIIFFQFIVFLFVLTGNIENLQGKLNIKEDGGFFL